MLGHWLGSDRVPALVVYLDATVKLAEEVVPLFPVFLKVCLALGHFCILVLEVVTLGPLVSVEIILMRDEAGDSCLFIGEKCPFNDNDHILILMLFNEGGHFVKR